MLRSLTSSRDAVFSSPGHRRCPLTAGVCEPPGPLSRASTRAGLVRPAPRNGLGSEMCICAKNGGVRGSSGVHGKFFGPVLWICTTKQRPGLRRDKSVLLIEATPVDWRSKCRGSLVTSVVRGLGGMHSECLRILQVLELADKFC